MRESPALNVDETTATKTYPTKEPSADDNAKVKIALEYYEKQHQNSNLPREMLEEVPRFSMDEVKGGAMLGTGGFCSVQEVKGFVLPEDSVVREDHNDYDEEEAEDTFEIGGDAECEAGVAESRKFIAKHCFRSNGDVRYAIKKLKPEIISDERGFLNGIIDLASETVFLSSLEHPNIIKLRGVALKEDMFKPGYFLILDRLYDTLEHRIPKWKTQKGKLGGIKGYFKHQSSTQKKALTQERMEAGLDLASAVAYLHEKKIIHRDLKSENIGFDLRDDIKIFDLGLAKEIPKDAAPGTVFHFTGQCGTPRYMAPEVGLSQPYNEKADVYSLSLLVWEILELAQPYAALKSCRHVEEYIWKETGPKLRPTISKAMSKEVKKLLEKAWSGKQQERPSAAEFEGIMRKECVSFDKDFGVNPGARRSTYIFVKGQGETVNSNKRR